MNKNKGFAHCAREFYTLVHFLPISAKNPRKMIKLLKFCGKLKHITKNFNIFPTFVLQVPRQLRYFKRKTISNYDFIVPLTNAKRRQDEGKT